MSQTARSWPPASGTRRMGERRRISSWVGAALLGLPWLGCAPLLTPGGANPPLESPEYQSYLSALDLATDEAAALHQLDARLLITATLMTPEFREAYLREYARVYRLEATERSAFGPMAEGENEQGRVEVLTWVAAQDLPSASLKLEDKLWRLLLEDEAGQRLEAVGVERELKPSPVSRYFFPYLDRVGRTYRVTFPGSWPSGERVLSSSRLRMSAVGVGGSATLSWELTPAAARADR